MEDPTVPRAVQQEGHDEAEVVQTMAGSHVGIDHPPDLGQTPDHAQSPSQRKMLDNTVLRVDHLPDPEHLPNRTTKQTTNRAPNTTGKGDQNLHPILRPGHGQNPGQDLGIVTNLVAIKAALTSYFI